MKLTRPRFNECKSVINILPYNTSTFVFSANTKLEQQTKAISSDNTKLKAQIKREVIHKTAVQDELSQKKKQNEELVKICDELISGQRS